LGGSVHTVKENAEALVVATKGIGLEVNADKTKVNYFKMDLQELGGGRGDWMELAQDRDRWRALVGTVRNFEFHTCGEFLD
jgi:hypothetical protein